MRGETLSQILEHPPGDLILHAGTHLTWLSGAKWRALSGGRSNFAWKVTPTGVQSPVVVKLYRGPARNPLFPNDPEAEARLLTGLEGTGIAPRLLASFTSRLGSCNIYTHLPGQSWQRDVSGVGLIMRKLHAMPILTDLRSAADGSQALVQKTVSILAQCKDSEVLRGLAPKGMIPPSEQRVLLHGDIVPGNVIHNDSGLHLIDWQCPAVGDPSEDIAMFLSPAMQYLYRGTALTETEITDFFAAYDAHETRQRYEALAPWFHWRMASYCQWQFENGRPDYSVGRDLEIAALQRSLSP